MVVNAAARGAYAEAGRGRSQAVQRPPQRGLPTDPGERGREMAVDAARLHTASGVGDGRPPPAGGDFSYSAVVLDSYVYCWL